MWGSTPLKRHAKFFKQHSSDPAWMMRCMATVQLLQLQLGNAHLHFLGLREK